MKTIADKSNILIFIFLLGIGFIFPRFALAEGRKFAVCVGINNYKIKPLRSAVNDATGVCERLKTDFDFANPEILTNEQATRKNILGRINFYQYKVSKGDLFVFFYSGHGTVFPDRLSDELDEKSFNLIPNNKRQGRQKYDSALIPVDSTGNTDGKRWKNLILDDELFEAFEKFTNNGAKVIFISDSCHSGNSAKGGLMANSKYPSKLMTTEDALGVKDLKEIESQMNKEIDKKGSLIRNIPNRKFSDSYLMIASAKIDELSSSGNPETGEEMSVFTYYFLQTLDGLKKTKSKITYKTVMDGVLPKVREFSESIESPQTPNFDARFFKKQNLDTPIFSLN